MIRREFDIFLTSLIFFTRIPVPPILRYDYRPEYLQLSSRYFPLIGILVGTVAGLLFLLTDYLLPPYLAVLLSMAGSVLMTGAFHEDGWADVCDGFGGGMDKMRVLEIMKDSRLGTYGTLGLIFILALKAGGLVLLAPSGTWVTLPGILIVGHALSRFASTTLIFTHSYVQENEDSKAKPLATAISLPSLSLAALFGLLPLLILPWRQWLIVLPVAITVFIMGRWFQRRIGGYTGDCLGAVQQVTEVVIYLTLAGNLTV